MSTAKRPRGVRLNSDSLYHRLFTHPIMVEQLVRGFVPEAVAVGLDFTRMELVGTKLHSRKGRRREADVIWRLPMRDGADVYLHLMFEFQSRIDWWMPVRSQVYTGLIWQSIIKEQQLAYGDKLPPVLSIVIYNGDPRWTAPTDISGLIALPEGSPLWAWQPRTRFYLLDEGAFPNDDLARQETLTALLFRLEHCRQPEDLIAQIEAVVGWFRRHPGHDTLRALFTELVAQTAHDVGGEGDIRVPEDLLEVENMLATRAQEWKKQWLAEGRAAGQAEGKAAGQAEGKAEMLLRLLNRRFPAVPSQIVQRVRSATIDQLDDWTDHLLDARSLSDIFGQDMAH